MNEHHRCKKCILPDSFPQIHFSDQGVCNFCEDHKHFEPHGEQKLTEILNSREGGDYDCVIPLSGGKDSTYILYHAVRILNKKVIAVNYDSGFQRSEARENVINACKALNVPLLTKNAEPECQRKLLTEILKVSELVGSFYRICGNCETNIRTLALRTARKHKVPFILFGSSKVEHIGSLSFTGFRSFLKKITVKKAFPLAYHLAKYVFYSIKQRNEMKVPLNYRFRPRKTLAFPESGAEVIYFFDYVKWDSMANKELLVNELGWKTPEGHEHRFDCVIHNFGNYKFLQECGISADGYNYAMMVREGIMTRWEAMEKEKSIAGIVDKECRKTIAEVGIREYNMPEINKNNDLN